MRHDGRFKLAAATVTTLLVGAAAATILARPEPARSSREAERERPPTRSTAKSPGRAVAGSRGPVVRGSAPAGHGATASAAPAAVAATTVAPLASSVTADRVRRGPVSAVELAALRRSLTDADRAGRATALREIRDRKVRELEPDVRPLLRRDEAPETRRLAVQVLALGDASANRACFEALRKDKDPVVRINAALGLARGGDEAAQAWLLRLSTASRLLAPSLSPLVERTLASPDLRSPAVLARYRAAAADPRLTPAARERAAAILASKGG